MRNSKGVLEAKYDYVKAGNDYLKVYNTEHAVEDKNPRPSTGLVPDPRNKI